MNPLRGDEVPAVAGVAAFLLVGAAWFFGVRALGEWAAGKLDDALANLTDLGGED